MPKKKIETKCPDSMDDPLSEGKNYICYMRRNAEPWLEYRTPLHDPHTHTHTYGGVQCSDFLCLRWSTSGILTHLVLSIYALAV
ncbi:unnamed protein product [Periconia digitata]|uniref:Uncharacterized protein n=1 Tax=Periconia digitata TaxID=1303443 RepID=A0A9W4UGH7_9PLEO|nr:unnamed protein product [Periconia digitata]